MAKLALFFRIGFADARPDSDPLLPKWVRFFELPCNPIHTRIGLHVSNPFAVNPL
jgi:hypothetical protein